MGIEEDSIRELKQLNQNLSNLSRSMGRMGSDASAFQTSRRDGATARDEFTPDRKKRKNSQGADAQAFAAKTYNSAAKSFYKVSGNFTSEIADARDDLKALRTSWIEGAESMFDMKERIDKWSSEAVAMKYQSGRLVEGMSRFDNMLAKATKAQSLLYAEQLSAVNGFRDFEKAAYFDELTKSLGGLDSLTKKRLGLIDEATGKLRTDLDLSDFKKVRSSIGELNAGFKEILAGTDFKSVGEMLDAGKFNSSPADESNPTAAVMGHDQASANREALAKMAALLQTRGMLHPTSEAHNVLDSNGNLKGAKALNEIDWAGLAKKVAASEHSFEKYSQSTDANVDKFNNKWTRIIESLKNPEGFKLGMDSLKSMTANFLLSGASFTKAKDKVIKAFDEIQSFNIAQIPASYAAVNKASVNLGLSFDETVKLMNDNKRMLAIYGPAKFQDSMKAMSTTFEKYGYNMKQAAELVGPTVETAIASGINIRDPGELNKFTDTMMDQFQKVSGMVGVSAQEFASLNKTLFKSEGTFEQMLGMDQQRRQAYAQELVQLRTKYVAQGLEIQQANELVAAQQAQQRGKLGDRTNDASKLMTSAQLAGLGSDAAMEVYRLSTKGKRSADENARLTELAGQINQGLEQRINEGYGANGNGAMGDILNDARIDLQTSGQMNQITQAGSQMQMSKEAGAQVSPEEQKAASNAAKGSESIAVLGNAVNKVSSIMNNAFLGAIIASTTALVAFGFQLSKMSLLMGGPGGALSSIAAIGKNMKGMGGITGKVGGAVEGAATFGSNAAGKMGSMFEGATAGMSNAASKAGGAITNAFKSATTGLSNLPGKIGPAFEAASSGLGKAAGKVSGVVGSAFEGASSGLSKAASKIAPVFESATTGIGNVASKIGSTLGSAAEGAGTGISNAAGKNAGLLGKAAGAAGLGFMAYQAYGEISDAEDQRKQGLISDKEARTKKAGAAGGFAGSAAGGIAGAAIGQALIPIPVLGALIGGAAGSWIGGMLGKSGSEMIADATAPDDTSKPATQQTPQQQVDKQQTTTPNANSNSTQNVKDLTQAFTTSLQQTAPVIADAFAVAIGKQFGGLISKPKAVPTTDTSSLDKATASLSTAVDANKKVPQPQVFEPKFDAKDFPLVSAMAPVTSAINNLSTGQDLTALTNSVASLKPDSVVKPLAMDGLIKPTSLDSFISPTTIDSIVKPSTKPDMNLTAANSVMDAINAKTATLATPVISTPNIGLESKKDDTGRSLNSDITSVDGKILGVSDADSLAQLQTIATGISQAVEYLKTLSEQLPKNQANQQNNMTTAQQPVQMNQLPSAYQFATGRV